MFCVFLKLRSEEDAEYMKQLLHYKTWCQVFSFFLISSLVLQVKLLHCLKLKIVGKSSRVSYTFSFLYFSSTLNPSHYCTPKAKYKLYSRRFLFPVSPMLSTSIVTAINSFVRGAHGKQENTNSQDSGCIKVESLFLDKIDVVSSYILWLEYVLKHALLCHHKIYIITRHVQISLF